jgi:hypothetical protein
VSSTSDPDSRSHTINMYSAVGYVDQAEIDACYNCMHCAWRYSTFGTRMPSFQCYSIEEIVSPLGLCRRYVKEPDR